MKDHGKEVMPDAQPRKEMTLAIDQDLPANSPARCAVRESNNIQETSQE
jgi:hypothetical protein